jgi:hypothetical protein
MTWWIVFNLWPESKDDDELRRRLALLQQQQVAKVSDDPVVLVGRCILTPDWPEVDRPRLVSALQPKYDAPLSNLAFTYNLRRYILARQAKEAIATTFHELLAETGVEKKSRWDRIMPKVGPGRHCPTRLQRIFVSPVY